MKYKNQRKEIIYWAERLSQRRLVTANSGNVSFRLKNDRLLVTAHDSYLGRLQYKDMVITDLEGNPIKNKLIPSSEINLHASIYRRFKAVNAVMHAHSVFTTAFFSSYDSLETFSFEADLYLKGMGLVKQNTINVTEIEPVLSALEKSCIVVLKNHGVVSVGKDFKSAFGLIELLEEQSRVNLLLKIPR
jgi:L-fuculose-phosphate aldolase